MIGPVFIEQYNHVIEEYGNRFSDVGRDCSAPGSAMPALEIAAVGNTLFDMILLIERNWCRAVAGGQEKFDPAEALAIRSMFESWLKPSAGILDQLLAGPTTGESVRFHSNIREAKVRLSGQLPCLEDPATRAIWAKILRDHYPAFREIRIADDGHVFELDGLPMFDPGVTPDSILRGMRDLEEGRTFTVDELRRKIG